MKLRVLGCYGGSFPGHGLTAFLVNDTLSLDAGWVSDALSLKAQARVQDILISHAHLDHTCTLPFLIDNNFSAPGFALRIYAIPEVLFSLRSHIFNNHTWPDFTCLPNASTPVLKMIEVGEERPFTVNGLRVRAVRVSHLVPTTGFIVEEKGAALAFSSDTGPTHRFWELANKVRNLKAVITETSFPNAHQELADVSGHLTPGTLKLELAKLERDVPVYLYGAKPRFLAAIRREVKAVKDSRVRFLTQGRTYRL